jgi:uncharacterized protein YjiS (DUF1127 family)
MTHEIVCCAAMTAEHQRGAYARIFTSGLRSSRPTHLCVRWGAHTAACIAEWRRRARSRRDLLTLNDRELSDAHLTRCDALNEASKPFWKK